MSRRQHYRSGLRAEALAAWWLRLKGYRILAMRYKTSVGEIDLVAQRGRTLAFVEVKGRAARADAAHAVHAKNQSRVVRAAQWYLQQHPQHAADTVRFDVCLVAWYGLPHHIPHAFSASS